MNVLKTIVFAIFCFIAAAVAATAERSETAVGRGTVVVAPLPAPECADTEVSTNFPLRVDFTRLQKLHVALELDESAANGLEVLLGCDTDGDGSLSASEASLAFGYDCGTWFVRKTESDGLDVAASSMQGERVRRELAIGWRQLSPDWDLVRVTRRGEGRVNESVSLTIENKKFAVIFK
mgnify:CR=1 FL=1